MNKTEILLSPIKIGVRDCQNRFFSQPMECNDADVDGNPTDLTYQRYENLFKGEAGLVSLEAVQQAIMERFPGKVGENNVAAMERAREIIQKRKS